MITLVRIEDVEALRFGRLEIINSASKRKGHIYVLCRCDCGTEKEIALSSLRNGLTRSCGCYRKEKVAANKRHGLADTRTHRIWVSMRQRCRNTQNPAYKNYGGRGIDVCPRWESFEAFLEDMGEAPEGLTLERIDNDKGYSPDNCKWATRKEQGRNTRKCRMVTYKGETKTVGLWADQYGIQRQTLTKRLDAGWDIERALTYSPLLYHNRV